MDTFNTFDTPDTLKELILSVNDFEIFLLFGSSNPKGADYVVGDVGETPDSRTKAGVLPDLVRCPDREVSCDGLHEASAKNDKQYFH